MSRILAFSFVLLLAANALGQKVSASLDRAATSVGESVTLSITCTNFTPSSQPVLPSIRGLRFSSAGTSRKFQLGGGGRTSTYTFNILITPLKPGNYSISPIQIRHETRLFKPKPLKAAGVARRGETQTRQQPITKRLRPVAPHKDHRLRRRGHPGRDPAFFYRWRECANAGARSPTASTSPPSPSTSKRGCKRATKSIKCSRFAPPPRQLKAGKLQLGPVTQGMVLRVRQKQNRRSPFNELVRRHLHPLPTSTRHPRSQGANHHGQAAAHREQAGQLQRRCWPVHDAIQGLAAGGDSRRPGHS